MEGYMLKKNGKHKGMTKTFLELRKGLTRVEAARVVARKVGGDWRGLTYDSKTGRTTVV
jgi:hypothetical protein